MLPDRKQMILKAIIENYIEAAEPIGSKALISAFDKPLSSATIRNEMSELEEMGLLEKTHISSGRIPSTAAYRVYVDELMDGYRLASLELERLRHEMESKMAEIDSILLAMSNMVSRLTNHAAIAFNTKTAAEQVNKVEIIPMDETGAQYAVVLLYDKAVKNRIVRLKSPISAENAATLTGFINMAIADGQIGRLKEVVAQGFGEKSSFAFLTQEVVDFINEGRSEREISELYLDGVSRLLRNREYHDVSKAGELLEHIGDPKSVVRLVEGGLPGQINIRIGSENTDPAMADASFVFTTYSFGGTNNGIIGIVAPTRMDYSKASAQLSAFVKTLDSIQKEKGIGDENGT